MMYRKFSLDILCVDEKLFHQVDIKLPQVLNGQIDRQINDIKK